ncbi:MAG: hypothetical protein K6C10_09340 [Prevotella sp.]|nr:hypothetical protein [Prevotella sp.]
MNLRISLIAFLVVLCLGFSSDANAVVTEGDYYICNDFFNKLLTTNSDGAPHLHAYDSSIDEQFIFTAVASGTSGYVKLLHKSTGKYLTASTSNTYSVLLSDDGSGDEYLWTFDQRYSTRISSKKNTSRRMGCDFSNGSTYYWESDYVPVYYDKERSALNWFSIIPANGNGFEDSRNVAKTEVFTNDYGVTEQDDYCVSEAVNVEGMDYHILSTTPFDGGSVNLEGDHAWLIFENIRPSSVISNYLGNVTINGTAAINGTNCRVEIWLNGAAVIPTPSTDPFVATTDEGTFSVALGNTTDLGENSNLARSFTLKRGYMATIATGTKGGDYSRVYVADHADLTVTLPKALDQRVTSVYVRNWHYVSKRGFAGGSVGATTACGGTWNWNWDANQTSTTDVEYIPIKQHLYWPSDDKFDKAGSTAMMLFNEPEHSEQHDDCSCGGTIDEWKAYTHTPKFNATGLRIGSPSATDLSYLETYATHCDNMKQRCDFLCTHGYWTTEWSSNLSTLKEYGRPVWITEWEYGASWTTSYTPSSLNEYAAQVLNVLDKMEYNDYVERYSYYGTDTGGSNGWMRELFWDTDYTKGTANAGTVYKKVKSHFAYNSSVQPIPNWWTPSTSTPEITGAYLNDGAYTLNVKNGNGDATKDVTVMLQNGDNWETFATYTYRPDFESTSQSFVLPKGIKGGDVIKVVVTTIFGGEAKSAEYVFPDFVRLNELQNLTFDEGTFTSQSVRTYAKDIKDSSTETSGMQEIDGWTITSANGNARASAQYAWGTSYLLGGEGYSAPSTNSKETTDGGCMGIVSVWTAQTQYSQNVFLPAGDYVLTIPVYNVGGTSAFSKNLIGFITDEGTEYLSSNTTYTAGSWTTETISFTIDSETTGKLSLGYTATNSGSGSMPHLFIDEVAITRNGVAIPFKLGDVNADGEVTIADVTALVNIILGKSKDLFGTADVNTDGGITIADVTALVNIILGKS